MQDKHFRIRVTVDNAKRWVVRRAEDGSVSQYVTVPLDSDIPDQIFTCAEVEEYDTRIVRMLDQATMNGADYVPGAAVRYSYFYWNSLELAIPVEGQLFRNDHSREKTIHLTSHTYLDFQDDGAVIGYCTFDLGTMPDGLEYASAGQFKNMAVSLSWLNATFPGWEARYAIATELELSIRDAVYYVFTTAGAQEIENAAAYLAKVDM